MSQHENAIASENQIVGKNGPFRVVLLTIYSVENAGIRYISAALQREGVEVDIIPSNSKRSRGAFSL